MINTGISMIIVQSDLSTNLVLLKLLMSEKYSK